MDDEMPVREGRAPRERARKQSIPSGSEEVPSGPPGTAPQEPLQQEKADSQTSELLTIACTPGLSHAAFRLFVILLGVEEQKGARGNYFPVTLLGLQRLHPGTVGKVAGFTTIIKQVAELRARNLLETRAAMPRNEPNLPILVRLRHDVDPDGWIATNGARTRASEAQRLIEMQ